MVFLHKIYLTYIQYTLQKGKLAFIQFDLYKLLSFLVPPQNNLNGCESFLSFSTESSLKDKWIDRGDNILKIS